MARVFFEIAGNRERWFAVNKVELVSSTTHQNRTREEPVWTRCAPRSPALHFSSERET
ncbi:predicted protein [Histoplasma mississippiense (nom. inval.)]|uniref:predicted protein n=1 Tax=Ajellomyces capsulatus (strain NAm1 / WU24) TaxID=2059318 RepID=UPI000157CCCA|nr:predicted protein [Histoplasma mississippiense (nom. inval.)]EDN09921.1 predicted protein [Histoplasma mississippiense (nom. inval.)]